ncbi:MAG: hypothetical protein Q8R15_02720 [Candidatus Micrarchaeota archaeon]|nr:hypothetical protein [Candidatus Micrarchaeota archaeon]
MVNIIVSGLKKEEHMFKESLEEAAKATAERLEKTVKFSPEDEIHLQIRSHIEGRKKRFDVKARITVQGNVYNSKEPDKDEHRDIWDLHLATKEALEELKNYVEKQARPRHVKGLGEDEAMAHRQKAELE